MKRFEQPIMVTRPLLPELDKLMYRFEEIWDSKWLTNNGHQHKSLEESLKGELKSSFVSLFNNGTIALLTALKALDIQGEVITTPFSFPATTHVLSWNGLTPVFCDIDPVTMNLDPDRVEQHITEKTTAILPVHVFGTPCDVEKLQRIADRHSLKIIYDAAHAFGVEINGEGIGCFGDISMFSFHATKMFHTAEGGALLSKNADMKYKVDLLKNFGIKNEVEVLMPGINGKMNEIQAAIGLEVLEHLHEERARRKELIKVYKENLKEVEGIGYLEEQPGVQSNYQYFVIRIDEKLFGKSRDFVYEKFKEYNVFTRKYFYPLISSYEHYAGLPTASAENLPSAHRVVREVLSMPLYGQLSKEDVKDICDILKGFR